MVEQATEKQINFARQLGVENPESFSKQAIKEIIQRKLDERDGNKPKSAGDGFKPQTQEVSKHDVVIQRTEKPHSYEFGKATARHKIYYGEVSELKEQIEALKSAGFIDDIENGNIQTEKY